MKKFYRQLPCFLFSEELALLGVSQYIHCTVYHVVTDGVCKQKLGFLEISVKGGAKKVAICLVCIRHHNIEVTKIVMGVSVVR